MKTRINIALRTLVEHVLRSGDLEQTFFGTSRVLEAIRAHQHIQRARPPGYAPEVTVARVVETDRFQLTIGGRIDGLWETSGRVVIEEIKTTARDLNETAEAENPLHWAQVQGYACMYAAQHGLAEIDAQLTYVQLDSGEIREIRRPYTADELERFFAGLVDGYLQWAETLARWSEVRNTSIGQLPFPFQTYRPGQRHLAVEAFRTIRAGGHLLAQAATGIGKTVAILFPALKAMAEALTSKIFFLTARTTGRTAAENALDELRRAGLRLKSLSLTAKDKICFQPEAACSAEECEFARGHFDRVNQALAEIFVGDAFTREAVEEVARRNRVCPFEFSLDLALWADCVICDYNYAFDPRVYLRRLFADEPSEYTFLVDEAHNLVDRAREMFSAEIRKKTLLQLRGSMRSALPQVYRSLGRINTWLVKTRRSCESAGGFLADKEPPAALYPRLQDFLKQAERWLKLNLKSDFRQNLLEVYFAVNGFMRVAEQYSAAYATITESRDRDLRLKLFCLDPAPYLGPALNRCRAAVFFSATLSPAGYFRDIFGCPDSTRRLSIPSPFPRRNFCQVITDRISTFYRDRTRTLPEVTRMIRALVEHRTGNFLLFFPSYEYLNAIHEAFSALSPQTRTLVQTPDMDEAARGRFLDGFEKTAQETLVGFAVMGGIFGEGIDLVGDRLCGVAVVGVGLPGISPERELIRHYFADTRGAGFEFAYLYPGINRVLQAAGRVIRSERDRGVLVLIDQRYVRPLYRSLLPTDWNPVRTKDETQLALALQRFWSTD